MPGSNDRRLRQQRLLLAGLAALVALSAVLLWLLRSSDPRRGRAASTDEVLAAAKDGPDALPDRPAAAAPAPGEPREERQALALEAALSAAGPAADAFEPDAAYGWTRVEGVPEPGVRLFFFHEELGAREARRPVAEAQSDGDGRFRVRGLEPHRRYALLAQSETVLPWQGVLFPGEPRELELTRAVTVSGHVRARGDGRPLAEVGLAFQRQHWDGTMLADQVATRSAADGSFRLPWAEAGMQAFLVQRSGRLSERREFQVTAEGGANFEILLDEGARLEFLVVDLASGAPLAEVELASHEGTVRTDARGLLAVPLASDGSRDEWVRVSLGYAGDARSEGRLRVGPPGGPLARVPIARGGRVRGRVLDAGGAPVAEALVRLGGGSRAPVDLGLPEGFSLSAPRASVRTDAEGRFELVGCVPRTGNVEVSARHPLHPVGRSEPFPFERLGQEHELEVRLEPGGTITGTVTRDGQPVALDVQWENEERGGWVRSNAAGAYRIDGLRPGTAFLRPRPEGDGQDEPRPEDAEVLVVAGETRVCDLTLVADQLTIEGRVLDTHGEPVADVALVAFSEQEDDELVSNSVETARDGSFVLSLPPVTGRLFTVWASKGPRELARPEVAPGTRGLELVLPNLARVALRVHDGARRDPLQGFQVYWRTSEDGSFRQLEQDGQRFSAGPDGRFLAELPAGRLDLVVAARHLGYLPGLQSGVSVTPERTLELDFALEPGVELELELVVQGEPSLRNQLRRAYLLTREQKQLEARGGDFFNQEIRGAQGLRADERGLVRLRGVPPGEYRVERLPRSVRLVPATFELPPVAQHRLQLTLEPAGDGAKPGGGGR